MNKLFAILFSFLILTQSLRIDYDHLTQIDELIEHAQFHKAEYGDNFLVFISKHYGELKDDHSKNHQEEKKDHKELPFQSHDHILAITAFVVQDHFLDIEAVEFLEFKNSHFHYLSSISTLHKKGLLHPPKLV
ncbi:hypothetical protein EVU94_03870 [Flavobacteriaceae bacterium 144Ye]|nr:hypothetical protein EVU94_03870 [Flavobacteriaceae bacterium 144Ye]